MNLRPFICLSAGAAIVVAGCGGGDAPGPTRTTASAPASQTLRKEYEFQGRRREVSSAITVARMTGRVRDPSLVVPAGRKPVRVVVRVDDRGRDAFPLEWARFSLGRVTDYAQTPVRSPEAAKKRSYRTTILTFLVPKRSSPTRVRMMSIVAVWPFRARWTLRG